MSLDRLPWGRAAPISGPPTFSATPEDLVAESREPSSSPPISRCLPSNWTWRAAPNLQKNIRSYTFLIKPLINSPETVVAYLYSSWVPPARIWVWRWTCFWCSRCWWRWDCATSPTGSGCCCVSGCASGSPCGTRRSDTPRLRHIYPRRWCGTAAVPRSCSASGRTALGLCPPRPGWGNAPSISSFPLIIILTFLIVISPFP